MIKAIIFDYFGVIRPNVLMATYEQLGGDVGRDRQFIEDTGHAVHRGIIASSREIFAERLGVSVDYYMKTLNANMGSNDKQLLDFIVSLKPRYKIGLLSNIGRGRVSDILDWDEQKLFDAVVLSGNIGYAKPEAEAYGAVADQLNVRLDECLFTDDNEGFCSGAQAVGMQAIHYKSLAQFKHDVDPMIA